MQIKVNQSENRTQTRFNLRAHATLEKGGESWSAHLINFSAAGALLATIDDHSLEAGTDIHLEIELGKEKKLALLGSVIHVKDHYVGLHCRAANIEDEHLLEELIKTLEKGEDFKVDY